MALLAMTLAMAAGVAQKNQCAQGSWWAGDRQFANLCYSDLPHEYVRLGLDERTPPLSEGGGRHPDPAVTPPTAVVSYLTALVSQQLFGRPDVVTRDDRPVDELTTDPAVEREAVAFTAVAAVLLTLAALAATALLTMATGSRPWDVLGLAAAPVVVLSGLIGWDLLSVLCVCAALAAWSRRRDLVAGFAVGLGAAFALYPALLLVAFGVVAVRTRSGERFARALAGACVVVVPVNLVAYLLQSQGWASYWSAWSNAPPGLGSYWQLATVVGFQADATLADQLQVLGCVIVVVVLTWLGLVARRRPRVPQLAFLAVAGVMLVSKSLPVQAGLWLLPLAALARPRWRDLLIWQACEAYYFCATWWYLGGFTAGGGVFDGVYTSGVAVRLAGIGWLAAMVVRDIVAPWLDPVRADAVTDDPASGVLI